jgi:hypothetical protein
MRRAATSLMGHKRMTMKNMLLLTLRSNRAVFNEAQVQFILGVFLFVVVVGLVDLRVPWPKARNLGPRS